MDPRILHHYERELRFVRELGAEFASRFPKIAGRLGITELSCQDPHVERLFQGFAFLASGVSRRLEGEFPRFTANLMESVYPEYLSPTPSMAVVQLTPSAQAGSLSDAYTLARGTSLHARSEGGTACEYRTAHAVDVWPIVLEHVEYTSVLHEIADLRVASREPIQALVRLRLRTSNGRPFNRLKLKRLPLFLAGGDERSARLYEALIAHAATVVMRWGPKPSLHAARSGSARPVSPLGFEDDQALLTTGAASFRGYRLLSEYFAFPSRFHFVELSGLDAGVERCDRDRLDVLVPLTRHDPALDGAIELERVQLYATPVINLFPHACDRISVADTTQDFQIVPDRARPLDYEVHSISRVAALQGSAQEVELYPERTMRGRFEHDGTHAHYALQRRPSVLSYEERRVGRRTAYSASDIYLSLLDRTALPGGTRQLTVDALCTNRALPLTLSLGRDPSFTLENGAPVEAVRCVAGPTAPRASDAEGETAWKLISQLSLNYLSLSQETGTADALRELLALYAQRGDPLLRREADGVRNMNATTIIRPMPGSGPRTFVRGMEVVLECEERLFAQGAFTLASVLSVFFAKHASIHSFTETVLRTAERGEIYRWPAVAGLRHTL